MVYSSRPKSNSAHSLSSVDLLMLCRECHKSQKHDYTLNVSKSAVPDLK